MARRFGNTGGNAALAGLSQVGNGFLNGLQTAGQLEALQADRLYKQHASAMQDAELRLKLLQSGQASTAIDPLHPGQQIVSNGISPDTLRAVFPGQLPDGAFDLGSKSQKVLPSIPQYVNQQVDDQGKAVSTTVLPPGQRPGTTTKPEAGPKGDTKSQNSLILVNHLEDLLKNVKTGPAGLLQKARAVVTGGAVESDAKVYDDLANALSVSAYRTTTGDTRLSDADAAARARPMIPYAYDSADVRAAKIKFLKDVFAERNAVGAKPVAVSQSNDPLGLR